ncbi:ClpP/crotonase [Microthyrium microscopicum]|uniref:3-hydroxyisobutyryl-CoA hydrolase n=1 Tax=Microthyrium microscopicum TaxID=703497 RepID=A0A6A6TZ02_9PEZI|nr:ClpP/crotonase [Microthyrium microscopicum]
MASSLPRSVCLLSIGRTSIRQRPIMPLKARISQGALPARGYAVKALESYQENKTSDPDGVLREDDPDDILFTKKFGLRSLELNRPKKLNSLNGSMARKLVLRLKELSKSDLAQVVVIKGAGRAFCAGGDVVALADWNAKGEPVLSDDYFALEYKLDHLLATYNKPLIAYQDGITMGGGVGLSIHAPFRIATENTVFAMPETTIGFFPEVGATFFLPRMDGELGTYLALTSEQLRGVDVFYHGIATHYIHSSTLPTLSERLSELRFKDYATPNERFAIIASTIAEYDSGLPSTRPAITGAIRQAIDHCFSASTPLEILSQLEKTREATADESIKAWADKTIATIRERSPIGVAVTLRALRLGKSWNIAQAFRNELEISRVFMRHGDFTEGVNARLVQRSKTRPNWSPNTLEGVKADDVDAFFAGIDRDTLTFYTSGEGTKYTEYPHAWLGLPTDQEIEVRLLEGKSGSEIVAEFMKQKNGKVGVREKVEEVVERLRPAKG